MEFYMRRAECSHCRTTFSGRLCGLTQALCRMASFDESRRIATLRLSNGSHQGAETQRLKRPLAGDVFCYNSRPQDDEWMGVVPV